MTSTKEILENHLKCFLQGDLDGILSDYAPQAILFTPGGLLKGKEAIRPLFVAMLEEFGAGPATFKLVEHFVEGDYGYIIWTAETVESCYELGTDTFLVREGKIVMQSFASRRVNREMKASPRRPRGAVEVCPSLA